MRRSMVKFIIVTASLAIIHGLPSLPTYTAQRPQPMIANQMPHAFDKQPNEEYYASQYASSIGIPIEETRFNDKSVVLSAEKRAEKAIASSAEMSDGQMVSSTDDNNNKKHKKNLFVVNPAPLAQFVLPPKDSVIPELTGSYVKGSDDKTENFGGPITNPAAYYLDGANIDNIDPPNCRMTGCSGPVPNDYDFSLDNNEQKNEACHQTFVPLNSCVDKRGYPVGMICTICCDCASDFISEMKKSRGYLQDYKTE